MATMNIDLGNPSKELYSTPDDDRVIYPTLHTSTKEDLDLPKEGTMTIRYKVKRAVSEEDGEGNHRYECDIQVKEIVSVDGKRQAPARSRDEAGDALDRLAEENYGEDRD